METENSQDNRLRAPSKQQLQIFIKNYIVMPKMPIQLVMIKCLTKVRLLSNQRLKRSQVQELVQTNPRREVKAKLMKMMPRRKEVEC
jgi:hypothetical protein